VAAKALAASDAASPQINQFPFIFLQRIAAFMQLGIDIVMVLDGSRRPEFKRNKFRTQSVAYEDTICRRICEYCGIPIVCAAGEGEAECSMLQLQGITDYVFSEDSDCLLFGARKVMMYASSKKVATSTSAIDRPIRIFDVDEYETYLREQGSAESDGTILFRESCILRALIQGGDYSKGVLRLGTVVAREASHHRTGFTKQLAESFRWAGNVGRDSPVLFTDDQEQIYQENIHHWRERLLHELTTNDSKFFSTKHKISAKALEEFPSIDILQNYFSPVLAESQPVVPQVPEPPNIDRLYEIVNWMLLPMLVINIRRKCDKKEWYESVSGKKTGKHSSEILKVTLSPSSYSDILRTKEYFVISKNITKELLGYILHQSIHEIPISESKSEIHRPRPARPVTSKKKGKKPPTKPDRSISEFFKAAKKSSIDDTSDAFVSAADESNHLKSPKRPLSERPSPPSSTKKRRG
jgi:hypothetical protein